MATGVNGDGGEWRRGVSIPVPCAPRALSRSSGWISRRSRATDPTMMPRSGFSACPKSSPVISGVIPVRWSSSLRRMWLPGRIARLHSGTAAPGGRKAHSSPVPGARCAEWQGQRSGGQGQCGFSGVGQIIGQQAEEIASRSRCRAGTRQAMWSSCSVTYHVVPAPAALGRSARRDASGSAAPR